MNKQNQLIQQQNIDDEQIEKTLNFFDSILDPYLNDEDTMDKQSDYQVTSTNVVAIQLVQHESNGVSSTNTQISGASSSTSSATQRPTYHHFRNNHLRYDQLTSAVPTHHVRRYTSENNLNDISSSSSKPSKISQKTSLPEPVRINAVSTEDLSIAPSWKNFSAETPLSTYTDKTNGTSASLIDLTSIDKASSRPRFRFIPPSNTNFTLKEESETEQQQQRSNTKSDHFHLKATSSNQMKYSHQILKPTVIIAPKPKSAPVSRLTETNIHHQHNNSAFKPPRSSKNGAAAKVQQAPLVAAAPVAANIKRTEPIHKPNVHIGITNSSNQFANNEFFFRPRPTMPQFHQSMLNLASAGAPETRNANMFGPRILYQPPSSSNFIRSPPYKPHSKKLNRHFQYPPPPPHFDDAITRRIQQVNNSSNLNGLMHPSYCQPFTNGGGSRSQQQAYPYNPYVSASSGLSSPRNSYDYLRRQQPYLNAVKVHKHHSPQNPAPVQSVYLSSIPTSQNGIFPIATSNIYHFNPTTSSEDGQSKRYPHYQDFNITTYL